MGERDAIIRLWEATRDRLLAWRLERDEALEALALERAEQDSGVPSAIAGVLEHRVAACKAVAVALDEALAQLDAHFDHLSRRVQG